MSNAAEDIVRRATAAFNAGRRDDAQKLCERGLAGQPNEPMLSHLLAAVLFAKDDVRSARGHIETSLAKRSGNAANPEEHVMEIKRSGSRPSAKGPAEYFTGAVRVDPARWRPTLPRPPPRAIAVRPNAAIAQRGDRACCRAAGSQR